MSTRNGIKRAKLMQPSRVSRPVVRYFHNFECGSPKPQRHRDSPRLGSPVLGADPRDEMIEQMRSTIHEKDSTIQQLQADNIALNAKLTATVLNLGQ